MTEPTSTPVAAALPDTIPLSLDGYTMLPKGKLASIVAFMEMRAKPRPKPARPGGVPLVLARMQGVEVERYLALYRAIGERWLWFSRLEMTRAALEAVLGDPRVEVCFATDGRRDLGLVELDFREAGACEVAFFGLVEDAIGKGLGRRMMEMALAKAFRPGVERVWLHTCNFDHPGAMAFYIACGFTTAAWGIEVCDDPRLTGVLPREAGKGVPVVG
jgi:GNAT superfamily N-acetyltransferase